VHTHQHGKNTDFINHINTDKLKYNNQNVSAFVCFIGETFDDGACKGYYVKHGFVLAFYTRDPKTAIEHNSWNLKMQLE
jgi:hypothetical protein